MPSISKAISRDRKINRRKNGHQIDNRGIFVIEETKRERARKIKQQREEKESLKESSI